MQIIKKDLTTVEDGIIVHGCNCSGGFGSGIAGALKKKWPELATAFKDNGTGRGLLGTVLLVHVDENVQVANCYTQQYYGPGDRRYADPAAIRQCLEHVLAYADTDHKDLYVAKIGCGLGGLSWEHEVFDIYKEVFEGTDVNVYVCDI